MPIIPDSEEIESVIAQLPEKEDDKFVKAFEQKQKEEDGKGWGLLAQIFGFHFRRSNVTEPFGPKLVMDGKRSMIPSDLSAEQLDALNASLNGVSDPEYRGRIQDILWLQKKNAAAGHGAIDSYLESGKRLEDPDHWVSSMERYERALRLGNLLGKSNTSFQKIAQHILERVHHYNGDDKSYFSYNGLNLLYEFRIGDPAELAAISEKAAGKARNEKNFHKAWEFHELAAKFHKRSQDNEKAHDALRASAERKVEEAEAQEVKGTFMAAHSFWNDAIQTYRRVPNSGERIRELHKRMNEAGEKMHGEMQSFGTEIDLSQAVKEARDLMKDKQFSEAVYYLVSLVSTINPEELRKETEQTIRDHPLQAMMQADIIDAAGRKVDVRPSAHTDDPDQYERAVLGMMDKQAHFHRFVDVRGYLAPAIGQMLSEHDIDNAAIESVIKNSDFIPEGRLSIFARGIRLGFEADFSTALHLLIPQLENSLRVVLAQAGVITTSLDEVGIEEAWPLGKILSEPRLKDILGESMLYELRSLLLGQPGSNIRNLLSHGLMDDRSLNSDETFYLWWLILKLTVLATPEFRVFVEQRSKETPKTDDAEVTAKLATTESENDGRQRTGP